MSGFQLLSHADSLTGAHLVRRFDDLHILLQAVLNVINFITSFDAGILESSGLVRFREYTVQEPASERRFCLSKSNRPNLFCSSGGGTTDSRT